MNSYLAIEKISKYLISSGIVALSSFSMILLSSQSIVAQNVVQADQEKLTNTSLQALLRQTVINTRTKVFNTLATVTWPILPQKDEDLTFLEELPPIIISNQEFINSNRGYAQNLIDENINATKIKDLVRGDENNSKFLDNLLEKGMASTPNEALAVGLDRRRVLEILKTYGGAKLTIDVGEGQQQIVPDNLVWEFIPYRGKLQDNQEYYKFKVNVRADDIQLSVNGEQAGEVTQTVKFSMSLLPDPDLPPIRASDDGEDTRDITLISEVTSENKGAGDANPLLLLVGLSANQFSDQISTGVLNSGDVSLIGGIVYSDEGSQGIAGLNASLLDLDDKAEVGVATGIVGDSGLYLGPSVALGSGTFVLSAGGLLDDDADYRFAGSASLDLSRLLFDKPKTGEVNGKNIEISTEPFIGLFTSQELLNNYPIIQFTGSPNSRIKISSSIYSEEIPIGKDGNVSTSLPPGIYQVKGECEPSLEPGNQLENCKIDKEIIVKPVEPDTVIQEFSL